MMLADTFFFDHLNMERCIQGRLSLFLTLSYVFVLCSIFKELLLRSLKQTIF